jgi:peptidyl-dipeptidase A
MPRFAALLSLLPLAALGCLGPDSQYDYGRARDPESPVSADEFLATYNSLYAGLSAVASEASWKAVTDVTPEHDGERVGANKAFASFAGARRFIEKARELLQSRNDLPALAARQLDRLLLQAAEYPGTIPDVVAARVEAESRQSSIQDGFEFRIGDRKVTANDIDRILIESRDLEERRRAWEASKEIGKPLKPGLIELQKLRNTVAREMGFSSFHALQVADYDLSVQEMEELLRSFVADTRPLYVEIHTWTKHELAKRYGVEPPRGPIPAHWIGNRWAQNWNGIVTAADLDEHFKKKDPAWIVKQSEAFYTSMGFEPLPESFWKKSDLYPVSPGETRKKNSHASAWHIDLERDVRSLMSVEANERWFGTSHHELGHIYYYLAYTRPEVPPLLRAGANRAFHEGIGELISIAALQTPYLREVGILPAGKEIDPVPFLLNEALSDTIPFIAWSAGVMAGWEAALYEKDLPPSRWNTLWWEYVRKFQGVVPPAERGEEFCDPATKTHVNDDAAQYYDYAIATVLKYQLHEHIARKILNQDPRRCNYHGNRAAGDFLKSILRQGATRPWREVLREATGEDLSTRALLAYFQPLMDWLVKENAGREKGWES